MAKKKSMNLAFKITVKWKMEDEPRIRQLLLQDPTVCEPDYDVFEGIKKSVIELMPELKNEFNKFLDNAVENV